ncbi:hypothetical protein [Phyllobacterium phragmitis]|uniref:hypothetical protein n=1 Tax=Phyllobacterium phragmitis TaxID=2670329 RepID=UPI0038B25FE7
MSFNGQFSHSIRCVIGTSFTPCASIVEIELLELTSRRRTGSGATRCDMSKLNDSPGLHVDKSDSPGGSAVTRLDDARLLILEQELFIALEIQRIVGEAGAIAVDLAHNLEDLDAYIRTSPPYDAVIMEVRVQGISTLAAAARLQLAGLPVVFVTAYDHYRSGVAGFPIAPVVIKPFESTTLVEAIITAISSSRAIG